MKENALREGTFNVLNYTFLILLGLVCLFPFVHVLAVSLSGSGAASAGLVGIWPVDTTVDAYKFAFSKPRFLGSMVTSLKRVLLGVSINTILTILTAYPLSKSKRDLKGRTVIAWYFVFTMLFTGGLIPTYLVVSGTGLRNTIWSLILPGAVPIYNVVVLLHFFKQTPKELEESAFLDGAGQWRILTSIYIPLAVPALATLVIFATVAHWNEWFSGMIYMNEIAKYPLATYLQNVVARPNFDNMNLEEMRLLANVSDRSFAAAQIVIATLPVILVYPFLQRYFIKGMVVGSLKG